MSAAHPIHLKRAYDAAEDDDGTRILVDGMWPRGVAKKDAAIDEWLKTLAPSKSLRQWFGHDPDRFEAFRRSYRQELAEGEARAAFDRLRASHENGPITLVFAARDTEHNNAVVLRDLLLE